MPISNYLRELRGLVGPKPLLTPGADALVYNDEGHLLLVRRSDNGLWGVPGGQLDPLEPPALGVVREVYEETGLKVRPIKLIGIFGGTDAFRLRYPNGDEVNPIVSLFECRVVGGQLGNRDGEATEARFFVPNALPAERTPITDYLLDALRQRKAFDWDEVWLAGLE